MTTEQVSFTSRARRLLVKLETWKGESLAMGELRRLYIKDMEDALIEAYSLGWKLARENGPARKEEAKQ